MDYRNLREIHARYASSQAPASRVVEARENPNSRALELPSGNDDTIPGPRESLANAAPWHEYQHLLLGHPSSNHQTVMTPPPYPMYKALRYPPRDWQPSTSPSHPVQQAMSGYGHQLQVMTSGYGYDLRQLQAITGYDLQQLQAMQQAMSDYDKWVTMQPHMAGGRTIAPSHHQDESNLMTQMQTPSYRQDELNPMPQMPSDDQPVVPSASYKGKAAMSYDPTFQMMALSLGSQASSSPAKANREPNAEGTSGKKKKPF